MFHTIPNVIDKALLRARLVEKQRVYAQMQKDNITGPVRERLSEEINQLNIQLYGRR